MIQKREVNLREYLPPVIGDAKEMIALLEAENPEFNLLWQELVQFEKDIFVITSEENGLKRWEEILEMPAKPNYTIEDRRFLILLRLNEKIPYTDRYLRSLFDGLIGQDLYVMEILYHEYRLDLKLRIAKNYLVEEVKKMLRRILPANLGLTVRMWFNQHFEFRQYTHMQMKQYRHQEIREVLDAGWTIQGPLKNQPNFMPRKFTHAELAQYRNGGI